jgi:hypothetical protein
MRPLQRAFLRKPASVRRHPLVPIVMDRRQRGSLVYPPIRVQPSPTSPSLVRSCLVGHLSMEQHHETQ